ncbi:MAG: hypothetical protein WDZ37_03645 [Solirubrobacterales bacterium]
MSEQQIADERRRGRFAGIAALATVALVAAGAYWFSKVDEHATGGKPVIVAQQAAGKEKQDSRESGKDAKQSKQEAEQQRQEDQEAEDDRDKVEALASIGTQSSKLIGSALLTALGIFLLMLPARHLAVAMESRRPQTTRLLRYAAVVGPVALCGAAVMYAFGVKHAASVFGGERFTSLAAAADRADELQRGVVFTMVIVLGAIGGISVVFWLIKGVLDANKIGLVHRWFAIMGAALPLLAFIFPVAPLIWLLALGGLFLGFWPGGLPPAWDAGRVAEFPRRLPVKREPDDDDIGGERNGEVDAVGPGIKTDIKRRKRKRRE